MTFFCIFAIVALVAALVCSFVEERRDLMMLQQNSYRNERYQRWLSQSGDTTSVMRLVSGAVVLASVSTLSVPVVGLALITFTSIVNTIILARRKYKKPLVMTPRARRLLFTAMVEILIVIAVTVVGTFCWGWPPELPAVVALGCYCFSHCFILLANILLRPVESKINRGFYEKAASRLRSMPDLKVIGITGSYGKTSTKHYLNRILSEEFEVCMTPGSFNTTLGVVRTINEYLKPYDRVFICEMGAKQPNDIKEICDLVHPSVGIITAVGEQHLESFKTIENVQRTKFELVDSLPSDGLAIVNDDFKWVANREVKNVECIRYAVTNTGAAAFRAENIQYTGNGTTFDVVTPDGKRISLSTRLVGECNVSNLLAAVICALSLGMSEDKIRYAVSRIEQVEHRLNMKRTPGGVTIIDDAFNSNPTGSGMALDVLASMKGGKRIVVTPGMIELGDRQYELNAEFGRKIAVSADVAVIVGEYNRDAITEGIESVADRSAALHTVASFNDAQALLAGILRPGDTILYENDLPDTFK
ncbi:MAG: UDP-N-acetylmuramoyl-tripeptide--D-alanyl-D-alanine ligase [Duncaniella sp.]|nr:UDP-N-acetylmuramoyl-tripeptide--D-alanyl-D-alanine ligase [Duncaniella sp.]